MSLWVYVCVFVYAAFTYARTYKQCPEESCSEEFKKHSQLSMHVTRHGLDPAPFKCNWEGCESAYKWASELKKHQKWHKGVGDLYSCT